MIDAYVIFILVMDLQKPIDYLQMFSDLMTRRMELIQQRDEIAVEIVKVNQLLTAMFPLLPENKQGSYKGAMENIEADSGGLQDAIKLVFSEHKGEWLTASNVRECLVQMGFDLRHYQSNPLASIGTTLKRMTPAYLESKSSESGPTLYRRRGALRDRFAESENVLSHYVARLSSEKAKQK
jgi:hypothetical protein